MSADDAHYLFSTVEEATGTDILRALINENASPDWEMMASLRVRVPTESFLHELLRKSQSDWESADVLENWEIQSQEAVGIPSKT